MNILLTGATGFIGSAVLQRLVLQSEIYVRTYGRRAPNGHSQNHIIGALGESNDHMHALTGIDVVIHCAALAHMANSSDNFNRINTTATLDLAQRAVTAGVKRFIFISSIGVNGNCSQDRAFRYDDEAAPWGDYSHSKYVAEQALRHLSIETGMEIVIIRPPLVYGPDAPGNFGKLISAINSEKWLPLGGINNQRSFVALDNLVDLIIICISHPNAANQTFLAGDDQNVSTTELLKRMASAFGKKSRLIPVPMGLIQLIAILLGKRSFAQRLCGSLVVDISYTKQTLNWKPPVTMEQQLAKIAASLSTHSG